MSAQPASYESAVERLEEIIKRLDTGEAVAEAPRSVPAPQLAADDDIPF